MPRVPCTGRGDTSTAYYVAARYPEDRDEIRAETTENVIAELLGVAEEVLAWASRRLRLNGS